MTDHLFTGLDVYRIGQWAAEECDRQQSGELSVAWMLAGWLHAHQEEQTTPTEVDIIYLGHLVEPRHNDGKGYRKVNVQVGGSVKMPAMMVPEAMTRLVAFLTDPKARVEPDEWYRQYEEIHPFGDGNGRTGSILWNWLRGTLTAPEAPPDFWSGR